MRGNGAKTEKEGRLPPGTAVYPDLAAFALQLAP